MSKGFVILLVLALLVSVAFNLKFLSQQEILETFKVVEVIDGDTFKFESGRRVRLLGVNAPEIGKCFSKEAKSELEKLVGGKNVTLENQFSDPYGRTIANVFVDGKYINAKIIEQGLARPDYSTNPRRDELSAVYKIAREAEVGIHSGQCVSLVPPEKGCLIKGNVDDGTQKKTFYLPKCTYYEQVQIDLSSNDRWFCSETEAKKAGFVLAPKCR